MLNKSTITAFSLGILIVAMTGCSGIGDEVCGKKGKALNDVLNATEKEFSRALKRHGKAASEEELPCIVSAINSENSDKRRNASELLVNVRGRPFVVLGEQRAVVLETKDVDVWAKVMNFLLQPPGDADPGSLASERHDMIKQALSGKDTFLQSVALKAGVLGGYPGIESEIKARLETTDFDLLNVTLDVLSAEKARAELPRLLKILADYESGKKYKRNHLRRQVFGHLTHALVRTEDPQAYLAVRTALEKRYQSDNKKDKDLESWQEYLAFNKLTQAAATGSRLKDFCYYLSREDSIARPWAIGVLTTQIEAGLESPTAEIAKICVEVLEKKNSDSTISCERLFEHLQNGTVVLSGNGERITGAAALEIGRKWLSENQKNDEPG